MSLFRKIKNQTQNESNKSLEEKMEELNITIELVDNRLKIGYSNKYEEALINPKSKELIQQFRNNSVSLGL